MPHPISPPGCHIAPICHYCHQHYRITGITLAYREECQEDKVLHHPLTSEPFPSLLVSSAARPILLERYQHFPLMSEVTDLERCEQPSALRCNDSCSIRVYKPQKIVA